MKKIFVAGHNGMVGSAICRRLHGVDNVQLITKNREDLDLLNSHAVERFFSRARPDIVVIAAAKVGGILANSTYPAEFIFENLRIQTNIIHEAFKVNVDKLLFLGSSCIYPKLSRQPIDESSLLSGQLETTNEPYAIAKIAGIKMCESYNRQYGCDFRCVMPTNLYGPGDNYHTENSHVIPALLRRFHEAKVQSFSSVSVWGSGRQMREFLHVDDLADACVFVLNLPQPTYEQHTKNSGLPINVGVGKDLPIAELCKIISSVVGFNGEIEFDTTKPDGAPRKLLSVDKLNKMGWTARTTLLEGLTTTYKICLDNGQFD